MLTQPLPDLNAWTAAFRQLRIPVLAETAAELQHLAEIEDANGSVDAHMVSEAIAGDPLMTLQLLVHVSTHRRAQQITDAETVTAAVMMMGIGPFFRTFSTLESVENLLTTYPQAREGLDKVLQRSHRAARFALGFAVHRMDGDAAILQEAALLHDFAEMLLWCHAPALATDLAQRRQADPTLRSADLQRAVLNVTLGALEQNLMRAWHLPELLIRLTDDKAEGQALIYPQICTVRLAVQLARHSAAGWDNPALPDDIDEIAQLLRLSHSAATRLVRELDS